MQTDSVGIIPYYKTEHAPWQEIAKILGYKFISPTLPVDDFVNEVAKCKLIITEAMHGAIISDAMRVPWIPYSSHTIALEQDTHFFKWNDWCASVEVKFVDFKLPIFWPKIKNTLISNLKFKIKKRYICHQIKSRVKNGEQFLSSDMVFAEKIRLLEDEIELIKTQYCVLPPVT